MRLVNADDICYALADFSDYIPIRLHKAFRDAIDGIPTVEQTDVRRALEEKLDSMPNNDSFSKDEIKEYLREIEEGGVVQCTTT